MNTEDVDFFDERPDLIDSGCFEDEHPDF
ncbi:protein of unknown function [Pseudotevenvirus RB43]|uniref:Uncharacterized protein n=2 Tax=Pseudotevenvirus RB43 TaxID=115991 RepID=Q56BG8_9CAUD|nr:hypothetical protein RB43ORF231w [Escherichia phage RB43]AAX78753.1 hypothetical protein RB43ORF231w [Escherichia phage RB43]CCK74075.1 protein of unknown function [Pseudotevenvirus RB43]CCL97692.1 protein of unknown function [Pseudotevenvirus RB43]